MLLDALDSHQRRFKPFFGPTFVNTTVHSVESVDLVFTFTVSFVRWMIGLCKCHNLSSVTSLQQALTIVF